MCITDTATSIAILSTVALCVIDSHNNTTLKNQMYINIARVKQIIQKQRVKTHINYAKKIEFFYS